MISDAEQPRSSREIEVINPNTDMPRYVCHKVVSALKVRAESHDAETNYIDIRLIPLDQRFKEIRVSNTWAREKKITRSGYFVQYEDGYTSWSSDSRKPARLTQALRWPTCELAALIQILELNYAKIERSSVPHLGEDERCAAVERVHTLKRELFSDE